MEDSKERSVWRKGMKDDFQIKVRRVYGSEGL